MNDKPPVKTYCGGKPNYCIPVDAVNMSQDRVDETAKGEHEPVAWQVMVEDEALKEFPMKDMAHDWCVQKKLSGSSYAYWIRPLYTAPPISDYHEGWEEGFKAAKREWVGLTDEEKEQATGWSVEHIEAKLKEKNT